MLCLPYKGQHNYWILLECTEQREVVLANKLKDILNSPQDRVWIWLYSVHLYPVEKKEKKRKEKKKKG